MNDIMLALAKLNLQIPALFFKYEPGYKKNLKHL